MKVVTLQPYESYFRSFSQSEWENISFIRNIKKRVRNKQAQKITASELSMGNTLLN